MMLPILQCKYFWPDLHKHDAEIRLYDKPDGTFLLRKSRKPEDCSIAMYTLTYRHYAVTQHAHLVYNDTYGGRYMHVKLPSLYSRSPWLLQQHKFISY